MFGQINADAVNILYVMRSFISYDLDHSTEATRSCMAFTAAEFIPLDDA
jgi:hypothetical protein